jgi:hypothetical protein
MNFQYSMSPCPANSPTHIQSLSPPMRDTTNRRRGMTVALVSASIALSLAACNQPTSEVEKQAPSQGQGGDVTNSAGNVQRNLEADMQFFRRHAPVGWTLIETQGDIARFDVNGPAYLGRLGVRASMWRNGVHESVIPHLEDFPPSRQREAQANPEGFVVAEVPNFHLIGFRSPQFTLIESGQQVSGVTYYNRGFGIMCDGVIQTGFACYWGSPDLRYGLYFPPNELQSATRYVLELNAAAPDE